MTTPPPTRPLPFPVRNNCYIYTPSNKDYKPQLVKASIEGGKIGPGQWGMKAHFHNNLIISENTWGDQQRFFTPIDCKNPTPEAQGYQKMFNAGGRRKNKSRRNKRKNRKTRRH